MNLILHSDTAATFENNGIGVLADAITAKVVRELNGQYELTLKYPDTGLHAEFITDRHIIMAKPDPVTNPQPFRIYRVNPVSKGTITVYARHIAHDAIGIPCAPFNATSCPDAIRNLSASVVTDCPFTFSTDKTTAGKLTVDVPKSIWNIMGGSEGSILDRFGGEYDYDGYNITLYNRLGTDRGVSIRYGKNLSTLEQDRNCANVYTGVFPYWKPFDGDVVMLPEQIINAPGNYNFVRILPLDLSQKFDVAPTEEQLREAAENYMVNNNIGVPDISWTVQFVQLEQSEEYKGAALLERVLLGDTVSVIFPRMNVNASARAVKIDFDPILERYNSVTLGRVKSNLATTIVKQQQEIGMAPSVSTMQSMASAATSWLTNGKGYKLERRDVNGNTVDTLYMDSPDINAAVNVLRIGQSGIGFSKNGVNGPYTSAWTLDGTFNADFIAGLELYGVTIKAGIITSEDGKISIDMATGSMPTFNTGISTNGLVVRSDVTGSPKLFTAEAAKTVLVTIDGERKELYLPLVRMFSSEGDRILEISETPSSTGAPNGTYFRLTDPTQNSAIRMELSSEGSPRIYLVCGDTDESIAGVYADGATFLKADKVLATMINGRNVSWKNVPNVGYVLCQA